jgi:hypothetical protein
MIAYDGSGHTLVLADGAELLVHDGPSEGPRWRRQCAGPLVAVGTTGKEVIAVSRGGEITWFAADREEVHAKASAGELVRAAAVSPEGHVLVVTPGGVQVFKNGGAAGVQVAVPGASAVAWGPGGKFLVVDEGGKIGEFAADGAPGPTAQLDGPPVAAAHNARGFWVVATAQKLVRFQDRQLHHLTNAPDDMPVRAVACAGDGSAIALALGESLMIVLSWPERDTVGQLRYLDRKVEGMAFGPAPWLAVALDGGDGNKLDLQSGGLHRTDTQPGRQHRRWMVQVSVNPSQMPTEKVTSRPEPAATPIAEKAAYSPPTEAEAPKSSALGKVLGLLAIALVIIWGLRFLLL